MANTVWAFDFDGVVCDSCGESSLSAWTACEKLWPDVFLAPEAQERKSELMDKMRIVRPVVETGYENILQLRVLLEGGSPEEMLVNWHQVLPGLLQKWDLQRGDMVDLFGSTRDEWMARDLEGWLAPNKIYDGVADPIRAAMANPATEVYIVTTKQARFTDMLMKQMAGIDFPIERIFSQTVSGQPKSDVLKMLQERHADCKYHFVEDKKSTLDKVEKISDLDHWNLYLVDWGYNTSPEREAVAANPRVSVIDVQQFKGLVAP